MFFPGPPYFFLCKSCGNTFQRRRRIGPPCPKCWSIWVMKNPFPLK